MEDLNDEWDDKKDSELDSWLMNGNNEEAVIPTEECESLDMFPFCLWQREV